jgi:hypothetical protein
MADLKVRVFKQNREQPATTVTIPAGVVKIASNFVPRKAVTALKEQGINLDELVRLSETPEARGTLVEIEDHEKNERIVISLE